ncbi:MAG: DUF4838 domain-containing protein [Candidatus Omnitrophica bacterium]|nr:DUF4838 domain-containing protein [Candidatus Omnitrophota bacterium]
MAKYPLVATFCLLSGFFPIRSEALLLAEGGKSHYAIVVSASASPSEDHAARELQHFLKEIAGVELPLITDRDPRQQYEVLVGNSRRVEELNLSIDWNSLGDEGYVIRTEGDRLLLAGGKKRGTLYAVYAFLEETLGCRWFTPDVSRIPKQERVEFETLNIPNIPRFEYRAVGWISASDPDWAARNKVNSAPLDEQRGGSLSIVGGVHNFHSVVPPNRYFEQHPEYYPLVNGKRVYQNAQLCLTNSDVIRIAAEEMKRRLRDNPGAKLIGLGQEDWGGWCECEECKAIIDREESPSGLLIHFLNQVAARIEGEFPDTALITLAYQVTRKPPKNLKPHRNVIPWVCGIECCYSHPISNCELNRSFVKDLADWAALTDRVYIFDYTANFEHYVMPHPNLRVLQPNFQLFAKDHVRGVYASGNTGPGSELGELRGYLIAKLLWNPDADADAIRREFMEGYYGRAAEPLEKYLALMHDKVERENIHCSIVAGPRMPYLAPDMVEKAKALFDEAEELADNDAIRERVKVARLPIQHVELEWTKPSYRYESGSYKPELKPGAAELAKTFVEVADRHGVTQIFEMYGPKPPSWHLEQQELWKQEWPAIRLENDSLRVDLVPGWGGRVTSIFDKNKDWEFLLPGQPDGREYPLSGGIEEYSERGGRTPGWQQEYEFDIEAPGRKARMWAELPNGLKFERTVELSQTAAIMTLRSKLTNVSKDSRNACLRCNPKFQMGPTEQVTASFTTLGGQNRSIPLTVATGKSREALHLLGEDRPNGGWLAINSTLGLSLRHQFDTTEVQTCTLDWLPSRSRFFMELQSPEKTLAPGEAITLTQQIEVQSGEALDTPTDQGRSDSLNLHRKR